jgi:predicted RNase H-like HicB family nuclease
MKYQVVLRKSKEGYSVSCQGLPGCWSQGQTEQEALDNFRDAIREYLAAAVKILKGGAAKGATVRGWARWGRPDGPDGDSYQVISLNPGSGRKGMGRDVPQRVQPTEHSWQSRIWFAQSGVWTGETLLPSIQSQANHPHKINNIREAIAGKFGPICYPPNGG